MSSLQQFYGIDKWITAFQKKITLDTLKLNETFMSRLKD